MSATCQRVCIPGVSVPFKCTLQESPERATECGRTLPNPSAPVRTETQRTPPATRVNRHAHNVPGHHEASALAHHSVHKHRMLAMETLGCSENIALQRRK